jgi:hypothetical protein
MEAPSTLNTASNPILRYLTNLNSISRCLRCSNSNSNSKGSLQITTIQETLMATTKVGMVFRASDNPSSNRFHSIKLHHSPWEAMPHLYCQSTNSKMLSMVEVLLETLHRVMPLEVSPSPNSHRIEASSNSSPTTLNTVGEPALSFIDRVYVYIFNDLYYVNTHNTISPV